MPKYKVFFEDHRGDQQYQETSAFKVKTSGPMIIFEDGKGEPQLVLNSDKFLYSVRVDEENSDGVV